MYTLSQSNNSLKIQNFAVTEKTPSVLYPRLAWILYFEQVHSVQKVCKKFNISRKTFYKWYERYKKSNGDPSSLNDLSRKPHHSPLATPHSVIQKIIEAKVLTGYGQRKLRSFLLEKYDIKLSEHTIWKILKKHYSNDKIHIEDTIIQNSKKPGDEVFFTIFDMSDFTSDLKSFVFTSVDFTTRLRISKIYPLNDDNFIVDFIKFIVEKYPFKISTIKSTIKNLDRIISNIVTNIHSQSMSDTFKGIKFSVMDTYDEEFISETIEKFDINKFFKLNISRSPIELKKNFYKYICEYNNHLANQSIKGMTPFQRLRIEPDYRNIIYFDPYDEKIFS